MKIDRLIGIITILLQKDKTTAPELAERFEVSRRTINRDIEDLCKAGIPVVSMQGYGGGLSLAPGYKFDKTLLTKGELQDVFAAVRGIDSVSKSAAPVSLLDKLSADGRHVNAEDVILIDLASHYQASLTEKIDLIKRAIESKHMISFQYCSEKGESKRHVEPYRLVFHWSSWYVFAFCLERQDYRLFKLNRLWDLAMDEKSYRVRDIPEEKLSFDDHLAQGNTLLRAVFDPSVKHRLIEEYGVDCFSVRADHTLLFERRFASYENMREWVFSFGDKVSVLAPGQLRDDRKKQAENIIKSDSGDDNDDE